MIKYVSIDISKKRLKKIGREIVLRLFKEKNILCKYQIIGRYLCLNSTDLISRNFKDKYGLVEAELCESNIEEIYKKIKYLIFWNLYLKKWTKLNIKKPIKVSKTIDENFRTFEPSSLYGFTKLASEYLGGGCVKCCSSINASILIGPLDTDGKILSSSSLLWF